MEIELRQTEAFRRWIDRIRDRELRHAVALRLFRLSEGLAGDVAPVGGGISELRIHYGAGYRIYFQQRGSVLILLLCAGDKSSQARDIAKAKALARDWTN